MFAISNIKIQSGHAVYTPTGAAIPSGSDGVVMIEYADEIDETTILVNKPISPGENIITKGSDIKNGELILPAGTTIKPIHLAVLSSIGKVKIKVRKKIEVAIISTGDEIISPDKKPEIGEIRNSNGYFLFGALIDMGVNPHLLDIVKDDFDLIFQAAANALNTYDMVLISGGSSFGVKDQTAKVIDKLGKPGILVHGISIKPGKPTIIGKALGKPVIGLPGHPASVVAITDFFVRKIIETIYTSQKKSTFKAEMTLNYGSNNGRAEFLPVKIENIKNINYATPMTGRSFQLFNLMKSDGFVFIPADLEGLSKGAQVDVNSI